MRFQEDTIQTVLQFCAATQLFLLNFCPKETPLFRFYTSDCKIIDYAPLIQVWSKVRGQINFWKRTNLLFPFLVKITYEVLKQKLNFLMYIATCSLLFFPQGCSNLLTASVGT